MQSWTPRSWPGFEMTTLGYGEGNAAYCTGNSNQSFTKIHINFLWLWRILYGCLTLKARWKEQTCIGIRRTAAVPRKATEIEFIFRTNFIFRTLGFSYRASFICVTIRITNRCVFWYYVFISFFSFFPYMFRAFMGPSSGVFQAVIFMLPFGSCVGIILC